MRTRRKKVAAMLLAAICACAYMAVSRSDANTMQWENQAGIR